MNKYALVAVVAFGGLLLYTTSNQPVDTTGREVADAVVTAAVPEEFSSVIPIHPHTTVNNVLESEKDGTRYVTFSVTVESTVKEVNEWYREALSSDGWAITGDTNVAGYQIIKGEKNNLFTSMQAALNADAGTVMVSQQAQIRP